jgi:uncharacterized Fe-S cluster protein YjdI/CDGSH-type Zn-finger protein
MTRAADAVGTTDDSPSPGRRPDGKSYPGQHLTVTFDGIRCLHAAECVRSLPEVFDATARPWIRPDGAPAGAIAAAIRRCPSGALQYRITGEPDEEGPETTLVEVSPAGRLYVRGRLIVTTETGSVVETRAIMCGCGASQNRPYCDASGACAHESIPRPSSHGGAE